MTEHTTTAVPSLGVSPALIVGEYGLMAAILTDHGPEWRGFTLEGKPNADFEAIPVIQTSVVTVGGMPSVSLKADASGMSSGFAEVERLVGAFSLASTTKGPLGRLAGWAKPLILTALRTGAYAALGVIVHQQVPDWISDDPELALIVMPVIAIAHVLEQLVKPDGWRKLLPLIGGNGE